MTKKNIENEVNSIKDKIQSLSKKITDTKELDKNKQLEFISEFKENRLKIIETFSDIVEPPEPTFIDFVYYEKITAMEKNILEDKIQEINAFKKLMLNASRAYIGYVDGIFQRLQNKLEEIKRTMTYENLRDSHSVDKKPLCFDDLKVLSLKVENLLNENKHLLVFNNMRAQINLSIDEKINKSEKLKRVNYLSDVGSDVLYHFRKNYKLNVENNLEFVRINKEIEELRINIKLNKLKDFFERYLKLILEYINFVNNLTNEENTKKKHV